MLDKTVLFPNRYPVSLFSPGPFPLRTEIDGSDDVRRSIGIVAVQGQLSRPVPPSLYALLSLVA
jgi:hypothetical protein